VRAFAHAGGVVYGECGGLMFLGKSIQTDMTTQHEMCGIFNFRTRINKDTKIGYVEVKTQPTCRLFPPNQIVRGQVYTFSEVSRALACQVYTLDRLRGGQDAAHLPPVPSQPDREGPGVYLLRGESYASMPGVHFRLATWRSRRSPPAACSLPTRSSGARCTPFQR
jgi:hypothetical protein